MRLNRLFGPMVGSIVSLYGTAATYTHVGGSPYPVKLVFRADSTEVDPDTGAYIISNKPMATVQRSELSDDPKIGDAITVDGSSFKVRSAPESNSAGAVLLKLKKVV